MTEIIVVKEPVYKVTVSPNGPDQVRTQAPGPQGAPGTDGAPGARYSHVQVVASTAWTVTHNLGFYPNVSVIVDGDDVTDGVDVHHNDTSSFMVLSNMAISGRAECS